MKTVVQTIPRTVRELSKEKAQARTVVAAAAENIDAAQPRMGGRLSKPEMGFLLQLVSEGKSISATMRCFKRRFKRKIANTTVISYRKRYLSKIAEYAKDFDFCAINEGLARRSVRVTKLKEMAEALEEQIVDDDGQLNPEVNSRHITEYRETMKQIAQEVGDMPTVSGDIMFVNMSDKELTDYVAQKMAQNKDMAVILSEQAGVRPSLNTIQLIDAEGNVIIDDQS